MEKTIWELHESVYSIIVGFLYYQSRNNLEEINEIVPQIQKFVVWFLEDNRVEADADYYQDICKNLLQILQDIIVAMEQEDHVLLHDALAYGFIDYLEMFLPKGDE